VTDLSSKVALITGSARGVGREIALRYASLGANIVVNYSGDAANADKTVAAVRALGVDSIAVQADVSDLADLDKLYKAALDTFARIDIVVANAGVEVVAEPILDATEEQFDRLFAINAKGTFFTLQKAAQHVADNGRIIYVSSSTTARPSQGTGLYSSSKAAGNQLVKVLALEIGHRGVTVNAIVPTALEGSGVFTDITKHDPFLQAQAAAHPIGARMGRAGDVADIAEFFASDVAGWVSGQALLVSGGATS
jgi:3-oxoacyl-[acyl-carrier protein] reductase